MSAISPQSGANMLWLSHNLSFSAFSNLFLRGKFVRILAVFFESASAVLEVCVWAVSSKRWGLVGGGNPVDLFGDGLFDGFFVDYLEAD